MFSNEIIIALCVSFLWGMVPILHKYLMKKMNRITIFTVDASLSFICILALIIYHYDVIQKDLMQASAWDLSVLTFSVVLLGVAADLLYFHVLDIHKNPFILPIVYCGPIFTVTLSYLFMKQKSENIYGLLGVLLILTGIICISFHE
jgi:uncharacterized membrane protein